MASINVKLTRFAVPELVYIEQPHPPQQRQDGIRPLPSIPLCDLDPQTISDLCDEFRKEVFASAGKEDPKQSHDIGRHN